MARHAATTATGVVATQATVTDVVPAAVISVAIRAQEPIQLKVLREAPTGAAEIRIGAMTVQIAQIPAMAQTVTTVQRSLIP